MTEPGYLTVADVAKLLDVSTASVYQWVRLGKLKAFKAGKLLRITTGAVYEMLGTPAIPAPVQGPSLDAELAAVVRRIIREELAS